MMPPDLSKHGLRVAEVLRNLPPAVLYEHAVRFDGGHITASGAIGTRSGEKTGRSPGDKRVVDAPSIHDDVWWGPVEQADLRGLLPGREPPGDRLPELPATPLRGRRLRRLGSALAHQGSA